MHWNAFETPAGDAGLSRLILFIAGDFMKDKIYTIYRVTNVINQKIYIGFDSNYPARKFKHVARAKREDTKSLFHKAIRKYGKDAFQWDVIYQSKDNDHTLNVMEQHFIEEYNSYIKSPNGHGYNMTKGGCAAPIGRVVPEEARRLASEKAKNISDETRRRMSASQMGTIQSAETRAKKSDFAKRLKESDPEKYSAKYKSISQKLRGRKHSDGEIQKRRNSFLKTMEKKLEILKLSNPEEYNLRMQKEYDTFNKVEKRWIVTFVKTGEFQIIRNLSQFCRDFDLSQGNLINTASGKRYTHKGWKAFRSW